MPIYQFRCDQCGHEFEKLMGMDFTWTDPCPRCGEKHVKKTIARSSFQLKGTGWYETDFKNKPKKPE